MTRRRLPPAHAFVDESIRGQRYLMGCALVETRYSGDVARAMTDLVVVGRRLHFNNESMHQRVRVLTAMAELPVTNLVTVCQVGHGITQFRARSSCLAYLVGELQRRSVSLLVLESRQDDRDDFRVIERVRASDPPLVFEHRPGGTEPLLWIADAVAWAVGAGGRWRTLVEPILDRVVDVRP